MSVYEWICLVAWFGGVGVSLVVRYGFKKRKLANVLLIIGIIGFIGTFVLSLMRTHTHIF